MTFQILITTTLTKIVNSSNGVGVSAAINTNIISFDSEVKADEIHRKLSSCPLGGYDIARNVEKLY